ncbi:hypothetical protein LXA43DRAFT_337381 [Ganoderma leucocontextum]|nr:hypothetical protein LXA43DRAFT_337381 [Ganoderma leucocontextum]
MNDIAVPRCNDQEPSPSPSCWIMHDSFSIRHSIVLHPVLPIDVFEEVVDQASDDTASLRQLSLTCSAFRPRARYHLFSGIVIKTVEQLEGSGEFLDSHPWLPPLIQRVDLRIVFRDNNRPRYPDHLLDVVPVHLLSRLPNLCSWSIVGLGNQLSLHCLTISCYRKYSVGIHNLSSCLASSSWVTYRTSRDSSRHSPPYGA